jgi:aerobic carbon-monoxide dehydrogenase large subunit
MSLVGSPVTRREDARILRGEGRYVDDVDLPGQAHVAFARSPLARARIGGIAKPEGALLVLTAADLPPLGQLPPAMSPPGMEVTQKPHPVLAGSEVHYAGQPVAAVVAETRALAEDIAELVEVDYEPLDAVVDARESQETLFHFARSAGDVEGAFAAAAHVVTSRFSIPRMVTAPMEGRGAIAFEEDGALTLWIGSQDGNRQREWLKGVLGRDDVTVHTPDVGGSFGSKNVTFPEAVATAVAATMLGRPVKWAEDRLENFLSAYQGRGLEAEVELALAADGAFLGLRAQLVQDAGAFMYQTGTTPGHTAAMLLGGCYRVPAVSVDLRGMRTSKVPVSPSRGAGRPEGALLTEGVVADAARQLGLDPVELRRRNFIRKFPYKTPLGYEYDSGDFEQCLDRAVELLGPKPAREGRLVGSGLGSYVERAGGMHEVATASVEAGGRIVISSGSQPLGTGLETTFAQIAADELGVPIEQVEVRFGAVGGVGTFASRSTAMGGSAVKLACAELREQGLVEGASATHTFEAAQVFSSGCYGATVAIDPATGELEILRVVAVDDPGTIVNPLLAEGQVYGGTVHGLGECLTEEAIWDEYGNPQATSFAGYHLLTAADVPPIVPAFFETPSPWNPLGAKGIGEGGSIGVLPAVANAVADALGERIDPPFTPQKLWEAHQ